jgi:hypothetical protein
MNRVLLIALVLGVMSAASGQTANTGAGECKLTRAQAPAIRGIRLGMTVDQALALFPGAEEGNYLRTQLSRNHFGFQSSSLSPGQYESKERFMGVDGMTMNFLDGGMVSFSIRYNGPEWRSNEQLAAKVAEALRLPGSESWKPTSNGRAITCNGFEVSVQKGSPYNYISLRGTGTDLPKILSEREEVPKEQARRAFRP